MKEKHVDLAIRCLVVFIILCGIFITCSVAFAQTGEPVIVVTGNTATLKWTASPEPDILGYEIESATDLAGPWTKAHEDIIFGTTWTDQNVNYGERKYYRLYAIDYVLNYSIASDPSLGVVRDYTDPDTGLSNPSKPGRPQPQGQDATLVISKTVVETTEFKVVKNLK